VVVATVTDGQERSDSGDITDLFAARATLRR
jgi:hypothetical protein